MLRRLKIENFVLVKTCNIEFSPGFNIITGETGAGKSVLLSALQLLLGARLENDSIRHEEEMASIEGEFVIENTKALEELFDEYELDLSSNLTIKREIHRSGKHKSYLNGQIIQTSLIKALSPLLLIHYDQETSFQLRSPIFALKELDIFAETLSLRSEFQQKWVEYQTNQSSYAKLIGEEQFKEIEIEQLKRDINALESLSLHDLDDETLFSTYQKGMNQRKRDEEIHRLSEFIDSCPEGLLPKIKQASKLALELTEHLTNSPLSELLESASASIQEASYYLEKQMNREMLSEAQLKTIEKRLSLFDSLKRKYLAATNEELQKTLEDKKSRKSDLLQREDHLRELKEQLAAQKKNLDSTASMLSQKRKVTAKKLAALIESRIRLMNMPQATFHISISPTTRSSSGDDECRFSFLPNAGEKIVDVHIGASNGELARIFLALSATIASKEGTSTILFDEIDANIGGITARSVGYLLKEIAKERQVLAITHFPQVAESADRHFVLSKEIINDRTITSITKLSKASELKKEHLRMAGKE